jgi:hypothetical protein
MEEIQKLLSEGKSPKEVIGMGFAPLTVYAVAKKGKDKIAKKDFEVDLGIYELIDQMASWIDLLIIGPGFADGTKPVPCLYCANEGEADLVMKMNEKENRFECPRCGRWDWGVNL